MTEQSPRLWSSQYLFLMAAIGSAVGLANMWKFPYTVGTQGGAGFILIYLLAVVLIATPVLVAELLIGRRGRLGPSTSIERVAVESGASPHWKNIAFFGIVASVFTLGFYFVIAGWTLFYTVESLMGRLAGADAGELQQVFDHLVAAPVLLVSYMTAFAIIAAIPVALGINRGIERCVKLVMPLFFVLLIITCGIAVVSGDIVAAMKFLFQFDVNAVTGSTVVYAIGQAFFSVGVGACVLIVFGAYLPNHISIVKSALTIAAVDTLVAMLAGLTIFPIIFRYGIDPAEGPGLMFVALPAALSNFQFGDILAALFFIMLLMAALTSAIAIALPPIEWIKKRFALPHLVATIIAFLFEWGLGVTVVLSFNDWSDFFPLDFIPVFEGLTFFGIYEMLAANIAMPVGGVLVSLFVGWVISSTVLKSELGIQSELILKMWQIGFRYIIPLALVGMAVIGF